VENRELKKMANWQTYKNLGGDSNVKSFLIDGLSITVKFKDSNTSYLYNSNKPGSQHIREMIKLAELGSGLGGYINKEVKSNYAEKI
jgi:hypothetical protein